MAVLGRIVVVLALAVAAACADESDDQAVESVVTDQAGYSVGLLDQGEDDRVTIRVVAEPDATQAVRIVLETTQDITVGGQRQSVDLSQTMDLTYVVRSVDGELITVDATFDAVSIDTGQPDPVGMNDAVVDALLGRPATMVLTERGGVVSMDIPEMVLDVDIPGLSADALDELLDQQMSSIEENADGMSLPVPVEPLGVGGSWSVATETAISDIPVELEAEVTITEITADRVVGDITQTMTLVEGPTEIFGVPAMIEGGRLEGTGTITYLRQGGIMPLLDMETTGTISLSVEDMTIDQTMTMRQTATLR